MAFAFLLYMTVRMIKGTFAISEKFEIVFIRRELKEKHNEDYHAKYFASIAGTKNYLT